MKRIHPSAECWGERCHCHDLKAEVERLRKTLNAAMNWALSNRGSPHEFVTCRSEAKRASWMDEADELLTALNTETDG